MEKIKDTLVVYLPQGIIIFPFHLYINKFLCRVLDRLNEWNILSEKKQKFTGKEKYFKFFVEKEINDILLEIKIVYKNLNLKTLTVFKSNTQINFDYLEYIENSEEIIKIIKKIYKKIAKKYFIENNFLKISFESEQKTFKGLKCGKNSGEEIEFINKIKSTWKTNM